MHRNASIDKTRKKGRNKQTKENDKRSEIETRKLESYVFCSSF